MSMETESALALDGLVNDGFFVFENYLSANIMQQVSGILETATKSCTDPVPYAGFDRCHIHDLFVRHPEILNLIDDPFLDDLLGHFLGESWVMYAATSSSVPPKAKNFASRIHVDCPRFVKDYPFNMGVIWTLSDYDSNNGCLEVLPGSHLTPNEPSIESFEKNRKQVTCKKGTMIVFNARLYHRTTLNHSEGWRHAMTMNACRSFMKQRIDWVRFIGAEKVSSYPPLIRRVLGFDTRVPANMIEYSLPETERLYKANQG